MSRPWLLCNLRFQSNDRSGSRRFLPEIGTFKISCGRPDFISDWSARDLKSSGLVEDLAGSRQEAETRQRTLTSVSAHCGMWDPLNYSRLVNAEMRLLNFRVMVGDASAEMWSLKYFNIF